MYACLAFFIFVFGFSMVESALAPIRVVQIAPFTGIFGLIGRDLRDGIYAAFNETNLNGGIRGRLISFESYDDVDDPATNLALGQAAIAGGNLAAFIGGYGDTFAHSTWELAMNASIPVVGHYNGANDIRFPSGLEAGRPFANYAVHFRPSQVEEYLAIVKAGFISLKCTKFSILYQNDAFGNEGYAAAQIALTAYGLLPAGAGRIEVGDLNASVLQPAIDNITLAVKEPQIVLVITRYDSAAELLKIAIPLNPVTYFTMPSEVSSPSFIQYATSIGLNTTDHVSFAAVVPYPVALPGLARSKLQERYGTMMNYLGFTNLNHVTMEGYVAGRMFVVMMENSFAEQDLVTLGGGTVTNDFVPTLYREKYVVLDDLLLGPFVRDSCSQGYHRVAICLLQGPAPYFVYDLSLAYPGNVTVPAYVSTLCGYQLAQQNPLVVFVVIGDLSLWMDDFQRGMQIVVNEINNVGGIGSAGVKSTVGLLALDDNGDFNQSLKQFESTLILPVMAYVNVPDSRLVDLILAQTNSTIIGIENPSGYNVSDPANRPFNRRVVNFWPSYYDQATSTLKFLANREQVYRISMVASQSSIYYQSQLEAVNRALAGFGLNLISQFDLDLYNSTNQTMFADSDFSSSDAVILFGAYPQVAQFIYDCQSWDIANSQTTGVNYTLRYFMLMSDVHMEKFQSELIRLNIPRPDEVYLTSPLKDFFRSDNILFTEFVALMTKYFPERDVDSLDAFSGYIMASFLAQVLQQLDSTAVTRFTEILYSYSEFQVGNNFHVGPLIDGAKSISTLKKKRVTLDDEIALVTEQATTISCNQGLREVFFYNLGSNMTLNDLNVANSYATCGAIIIIPPSWVEYYDCSAHVFINDTALIIDPLANPTYIRSELTCDGYFDCPDYTDEHNPRCSSGSPVWAGNIVWTIFSGIGIIEVFVFIAIVLIYYRDPIFVSVSPWFLLMALFGCILIYVSIILNGAPLTRGACSSAEWTVVLGLSFLFCSVLARVWRVFRLVGGSKDLRTLRKIPDIALWGVTLFLMSIPIVILIVWQSAFPISPTTVKICNDPDPVRCFYRSYCSSNNYWIFFGVIAGYHFTVLIICAYIAIKTRKVSLDKRWSEGRALAATIYLFLTLGCIMVPVSVTMQTSNSGSQGMISTENRFFLYNFGCALLFFATFVTINAQMLKRVYYVGELTEEDIKFRVRKGGSDNKLSAGTVNATEEWVDED